MSDVRDRFYRLFGNLALPFSHERSIVALLVTVVHTSPTTMLYSIIPPHMIVLHRIPLYSPKLGKTYGGSEGIRPPPFTSTRLLLCHIAVNKLESVGVLEGLLIGMSCNSLNLVGHPMQCILRNSLGLLGN